MRLRFIIASLIWSLAPAIGFGNGQSTDQPRCTMDVRQSPAIRGIRLGMSAEEVLAFFPVSSNQRRIIASSQGEPNYGLANLSFQISSMTPPTNERFDGIEFIDIKFFDGQLVETRARYNGPGSYTLKGPFWRSVDEFVTKLSEAFGLPPATDWTVRGESGRGLQCTGFSLTALVLDGIASIVLRSTVAYEDKARQRALADQERRRREFKP